MKCPRTPFLAVIGPAQTSKAKRLLRVDNWDGCRQKIEAKNGLGLFVQFAFTLVSIWPTRTEPDPMYPITHPPIVLSCASQTGLRTTVGNSKNKKRHLVVCSEPGICILA